MVALGFQRRGRWKVSRAHNRNCGGMVGRGPSPGEVAREACGLKLRHSRRTAEARGVLSGGAEP